MVGSEGNAKGDLLNIYPIPSSGVFNVSVNTGISIKSDILILTK